MTAGLDALAFPYSIIKPRALDVAAGPPGAVYCLSSRLASGISEIPGPTVVILCGALLTDWMALRLRGRHVCTLEVERLTPASLLRAVILATSGSDVDFMTEQILRIGRLKHVPPRLVTAFLTDPARMTRLTDLRRTLGPLSRESAQKLVRSTGFSRTEHLFTALRCVAWVLLRSAGIKCSEVEQYLGLVSRTSFRRACGRAGVPAPSNCLCLEDFDGCSSLPRHERRYAECKSATGTLRPGEGAERHVAESHSRLRG